nr:hypothetical protein [Kibdelosporangium sp. MJ126-NF4]CEL12815.1 hypothetical protein [Kibdelosporangium sp. MJ126-NF4]CTQ98501.1 hypothetical protein [Kibdelosporangium sp. MJ126-NF4]
MTYTAAGLWQDVVYVAYHLHWPPMAILDLDHRSRETVIARIGDIHADSGRTG